MRIFFLLLMLLPTTFCTEISAQGFLKKIAKGIESAGKEVDKVLGTDTLSQRQSPAQQQSSARQSKTSTAKAEPQIIKPFVSERTKKIATDWGSYTKLEDFSDGIAFVNNPKKKPSDYSTIPSGRGWGAIDAQGNIIIPFSLGSGTYIPGNENWASMKYNSGICIIHGTDIPQSKSTNPFIYDKKGKVVKELQNVYGYTQFKDSIAHIWFVLTNAQKKRFYRFAYIDPKGDIVYPHLTADVAVEKMTVHNLEKSFFEVKEGLRKYWSYKTGYGFFDTHGKIIVEPKYRLAHDFSDGLAAVQNWDEQWGFIDKTGKVVIGFNFYNEPGDFHEGYAVVTKRDGTNCLIDKTGNVQNEQLGNYVLYLASGDRFINGIMPTLIVPKGERYGSKVVLLNKDLKTYTVIPDTYKEAIHKSGETKLIDYKNGYYRLSDYTVLSPKFEVVSKYSNRFQEYGNINNNLMRFNYNSDNG